MIFSILAHLFDQLGDPKIKDLHQTVATDHYIFRLDIAVDYASSVRGRKRARRLQTDVDRCIQVDRPCRKKFAQGRTFNKLGDDEIVRAALPDLVDRYYIRMIQLRDRECFALKPTQ